MYVWLINGDRVSHFGAVKACRFELHAGGNTHDRKPPSRRPLGNPRSSPGASDSATPSRPIDTITPMTTWY